MAELEAASDPRRLEDFLAHPQERQDVELKQWLDLSDATVRAKVARHLMALANHGGGWLQFGFVEQDNGEFVHEFERACPDDAAYSTDYINGIISHYARPEFHCEVHRVPCNSCPGPHVLIRVPGGHPVPIVSKRGGPDGIGCQSGATYGRLSGPRSEALSEADDWHRLLDRCLQQRRDELLQTIRDAIGLLGADELRDAIDAETQIRLGQWTDSARSRLDERLSGLTGPNPYAHGSWSVAYQVLPPVSLTAEDLQAAMKAWVGTETGWPPWMWSPVGDSRDPHMNDDEVECWMHSGGTSSSSHADYWRASFAGRLFLLRGYDEDAAAGRSAQFRHIASGTLLDPVLAVWRIGECLLHAERFATYLGGEYVEVSIRWEGLAGRRIGSITNPPFLVPPRAASQDQAHAELRINVGAITASLTDIVRRLTGPLFAVFEFLEVPDALIASELERMRSGG